MFYDFSAIDPAIKHDPAFGAHCHPNCDCGRFIEIGNSVFIQYIKQADGTFKELPKRNVDFGGGLERLTAATLGNPDIFFIDVFNAARHVIETKSGRKYGESAEVTRSYRIILDHMRAASFMLATGVVPGNTEQPYVLRRLIRRSIREADKLGIKDAVLAEVAAGFGAAYAEAYPFVAAAASKIKDELEREEAQFRTTLRKGIDALKKIYGRAIGGIDPENLPPGMVVQGNVMRIDGREIFRIYETFGVPPELSQEIMTEGGLRFDDDTMRECKAALEEHQAKSRAGAAGKFAGGLADHAEQTVRYHTAHHLLLKALQSVLGSEVHQRGSNITSERLRMDFSYGQKMTPEQIKAAEELVNQKIQEGIPVVRTQMKREEAEKLGAEHEFGANYPEMVTVYSVGPLDSAFSIEFCGGPHVENTAEIGADGKVFKIKKEEASSAGVRRIRGVLE